MNAEIDVKEIVVAAIARFEGYRDKAYLDPVGIWTIGYGTTRWPDEQPVRAGETIGAEAARMILREDVFTLWTRVSLLARNGRENRIGAMTSLAYNVGLRAFAHSTLLQYHIAMEYDRAAEQFGRWVKAGGRTLPGLVKRRAWERQLYTQLLSQEARALVPVG